MVLTLWLLVGLMFQPSASHRDLQTKQALACRPVPIKSKAPGWPKKVKAAGYRDHPVVSFEVKETGEVDRVLLERSSGAPDIDKAVTNKLKAWKFKPQPGCGVRELKMSVMIHFGPARED